MYWLCVYVLFCYLAIIPYMRWIIKPLWGAPPRSDAGFFFLTAPVSLPVGLVLIITLDGFKTLSNVINYLIGE